MTTVTFETITFRADNEFVHVDLLRSYTTKILNEELRAIAPFTITSPHQITFENIPVKRAETKFFSLLTKSFENLTTKLTGNPATYIHRNSGIPLIGNVAFGIVYRGSSIIEIKTNNGCNLDCVYCSIAEGLSSRKHDFVIEKDYLLDELDRLLEFVGEPVEIHIGVQGEPFLYGDMENLIGDLQEIEQVHTISIDTNGTLLSKQMIDRLAHCTKLQLNLSLDALDDETAKDVAGVKSYNVKYVQEIIAYACSKLKVIVAPVLTPGFNEQEMEKIILFVKSLPIQPILGIQNFLRYKAGRNPGKEMSWEDFYTLLKNLEQKHEIKLRLDKTDFAVRETKELPKPFKEGDIIPAVIKCPDRFPNSVLAVARGRSISVPSCSFQKDKQIKVKILRDKHNIFVGKLV
ncbi:radical SAM protein [Candidatus Woesearchaeota archaeon]|nr:radical SAM protein [Candidatus Woesearchaeota archaeon]